MQFLFVFQGDFSETTSYHYPLNCAFTGRDFMSPSKEQASGEITITKEDELQGSSQGFEASEFSDLIEHLGRGTETPERPYSGVNYSQNKDYLYLHQESLETSPVKNNWKLEAIVSESQDKMRLNFLPFASGVYSVK